MHRGEMQSAVPHLRRGRDNASIGHLGHRQHELVELLSQARQVRVEACQNTIQEGEARAQQLAHRLAGVAVACIDDALLSQ